MCLLLAITNTLAAPAATKNTTLSSTTKESSLTSNKTETSTNVIRNSLLHLLSSQSSASHSRLRKRHSKRQSNNFDGFDLDVNSTALEWVNPCGGYFDPTAVTNHKSNRTAILKKLKEAIDYELDDLNFNLKPIDAKSFRSWSLYEDRYEFLKMKKKCTKRKVPLKRWYRSIETYTATFAYLLRVQLRMLRTKTDNDDVNELRTLLRSSRSTLCELEIAINKTHPNHAVRNHLPQVSRNEMNRHLKLITREKAIEHPGVVREINTVDFEFSKVYFKRFLKKMAKMIENRKTTKVKKNCGRKTTRKGGNRSSSSNVNAKRKQQQHSSA